MRCRPLNIRHGNGAVSYTHLGQNGHGIPVLTYEEMAGLVLGYDPWVLGMQMHQVDVEPLLDKMPRLSPRLRVWYCRMNRQTRIIRCRCS